MLSGRIVIDYFPHIFGPTEDQPLDIAATRAAFNNLAGEINQFYSEFQCNHDCKMYLLIFRRLSFRSKRSSAQND
jgi:hypothetical protein